MLSSGAIFSPCKKYRYTLWRAWEIPEFPQVCLWIMLNPSVADEKINDPTVARCIKYSQGWGFTGLIVCNIFAVRSTDPRILYNQPNCIGPENDAHITRCIKSADKIICAWGNHGQIDGRGKRVLEMISDSGKTPYCLEQNSGGEPKHPLYCAGNLAMTPMISDELRF